MSVSLHALQDDFNLTSNADTHSTVYSVITFGPFYLVDESGNNLTDELGNRLIAFDTTVDVGAIVLHALPDDLNLNAE